MILPFYRLAQAVLYIGYKILFRFKVYGIENLPKDSRGVIIASNHASFLDPPLVGVALKRPVAFLAKDYLFKVFLLGTLIRWLGSLPIKSGKDDFRSMRELLRALKSGKQVLIFPEGTRSKDGKLQPVEGGVGFLAIKSECYVVPTFIQGTYEAFPKGAKFLRPHPVKIYFGKPFIPALDQQLLASQNAYLAVSEKIMSEIQKMKEEEVV